MMPTIRIDDDVFNGLKALAEPFVDTPNSVIRKLLEASGALTRLANGAAATPTETVGKSTSVPAPQSLSGLLTPQTVYESFLLHVLATEFKGRGHKRVVTERVIEAMKAQGHIGPADLERVSTGETKAENTIAWGRNALKERGLISRSSPKGIWELTASGMEQGKRGSVPRKQ
jgi:hypothetical protein